MKAFSSVNKLLEAQSDNLLEVRKVVGSILFFLVASNRKIGLDPTKMSFFFLHSIHVVWAQDPLVLL